MPAQPDDLSVDYSAEFGTSPPHGVSQFVTAGGVDVTRTVSPFEPGLLAEVTRQADQRRGGTFSSGMEYPGRYSRWHMGYVDPCVEIVARGREVTATALNDRGAVILPAIGAALGRAARPARPAQPASPAPDGIGQSHGTVTVGAVTVVIPEAAGPVPEEERSRRPTVFSAIREIIALFAGPDEHLGLFGAFGYDLAFQFEPLRLRPGRDEAGSGLASAGNGTWSCTCRTSCT